MTIVLPEGFDPELVFALGGLAMLLFGWLIFRLGTRLLGVALGAGFGFFIGEVLGVVLQADRNTGLYITVACSIVGALGAIFLIKAVTNFLFALIGFLFGALVGRIGADIYAHSQQVPFELASEHGVIILVTAIVVALLAVLLQRWIMILITSYMGATFLVAGVDMLAQQPLAFPVVLVLGILWQGYAANRLFRDRRKYRQNRDDTD